jgi:hypothetical protein
MKTSGCRFLFAAYPMAILFAFASEANAADNGMFLCRSPVFAGTFYGGLLTAQQTGVQLDKKIAESIAKKNDCKFVPSDKLKPIDFVAGELAITDGNIKGWADPHLYIIYVNRPAN